MPFPCKEDRRALLKWARQAVVETIKLGQLAADIPRHGMFLERRGVFVTLHVHGRLRGCIGVVETQETLGESIARCAISAALHDPRFPPVRKEELDGLALEISLMSVPAPIRIQEIEIGKHGLLVVSGAKRGLLLPQVAVEHGLDRERFLRETCRKAGLDLQAWNQNDVQIHGFTCVVISESNGESKDRE